MNKSSVKCVLLLICFLSLMMFNFSIVKAIKNDSNIIITNLELEPKISVVLSGGGARGFSQIGVLKSLEENNIQFSNIVGTSIGAILGGLYASGYSANDLDTLVRRTNWSEVFSLNNSVDRSSLFFDQKLEDDRNLLSLRFKDFSLQIPKAISNGNNFNLFLQNLIWASAYLPYGDFDKLKVQFRAVTTDLISGHSYTFSYGDLVKAIRASATVPLRFQPIIYQDKLLVDGGILANIPINQTKEFSPNFIIAVNSTSELTEKEKLQAPWDIADQVVTIMSEKLQNWYTEPDFLIKPEIGDYSNLNFDSVQTLINTGYKATQDIVSEIKQKVLDYKDSVFQQKILDIKLNVLSNNNEQNIENVQNVQRDKIKYENCKNYEIQIFDKYLSSVSSVGSVNSTFSQEKNQEERNRIKKEFFDLLSKYQALYITRSVQETGGETTGETTYTFSFKKFPAINQVIVEYNTNGVYKNTLNNNTLKNNSEKLQDLSNILNLQIGHSEITSDFKKKTIEKVNKYFRDNNLYFNYLKAIELDSNKNVKIDVTPIVVGKISIKGNQHYPDYLILRELEFEEGDLMEPQKLNKSWLNLTATDLFYYVGFDLKIDENSNLLEIIISVEEKGSGVINFGFKSDNERQGQVNIDLKKLSLFVTGLSTYINYFGGNRNQNISFSLENYRIYSTNLGFKLSSYYDNKNIYHYSQVTGLAINEFRNDRSGEWKIERLGGKLSLSGQIEKLGKTYTELRYENQRMIDIQNSYYENFYRIATLKVGTVFDTENEKFFPTKGTLFSVDFESSIFDDEYKVSFSKFNLYYHTSLSMNNFTFKPKFMFGVADQTTPIPEQYSFGGLSNFLGAREDEVLGRQIFVSSLEARYKLPFKIVFDSYLSARYDLGNTWLTPTDIRLSSLKHGAGLVLDINAPFLPIKVALGKSFYFIKNPNAVVLGPLLLYFSIGAKF